MASYSLAKLAHEPGELPADLIPKIFCYERG